MLKQCKNGIHRGGFARTGAAGQHQYIAGECLTDCLPLQGCIGKALPSFQRVNVPFQVFRLRCQIFCQIRQTERNVRFGAVQIRQVHIFAPSQIAPAEFPILHSHIQLFLNFFLFHPNKR